MMIPGWGIHDSWLDLTGNIWFTCNIPNKRTTIGRIDSKTGEVKLFKVARTERARRADARHDARSERHHLVQRQ